MNTPDWDSIEAKPYSSLIVFHGKRNEEGINGDHYYAFDGRNFRLLVSKEVKESRTLDISPPGVPPDEASPPVPPPAATPSADGGTPSIKVTNIPTMFRGTWKLQAGNLTPCSTKQTGDDNGQNTAVIDASSVHMAPDFGRFDSGSVSTSETASGFSINSMTVQLNYGDDVKAIQTETWSVKEVNGQKVLTILRKRNMSVDLLTKCSG